MPILIRYENLVRNLLVCGSVNSASNFATQALRVCDDRPILAETRLDAMTAWKNYSTDTNTGFTDSLEDLKDLPDRTAVRRELYPWNIYEPDRFSLGSLTALNNQLMRAAPNLEVRATELPVLGVDGVGSGSMKQLGLFAKKDLSPGELTLNEKSLLTASAVMRGSFCDACSAPLSDLCKEFTSVPCPDCDDIVFCGEECLSLAQSSYHPALCGSEVEAIATDPPKEEASDALYALLLLRSLALAETQGIHPLHLAETRYIWGDYVANPADIPLSEISKTLPWSFRYNILLPLHMLEKINVNIFEKSMDYDFWVFNTLYAKFRGTASARQGPDGRPDVGAVHPIWCLANHSCDPNVRWDWQGSIKFWVREERVTWVGRNSPNTPGIKQGDQIFSHYCDIDLPVAERRAWAVGALGGNCQCDRCRWEEEAI
jgi:hypothetical protein